MVYIFIWLEFWDESLDLGQLYIVHGQLLALSDLVNSGLMIYKTKP